MSKLTRVKAILHLPAVDRTQDELALVADFVLKMRLPAFQDVDSTLMVQLARDMQYLFMDSKEVVYNVGDPITCTFILLTGSVNLFKLKAFEAKQATSGNKTASKPPNAPTQTDPDTSCKDPGSLISDDRETALELPGSRPSVMASPSNKSKRGGLEGADFEYVSSCVVGQEVGSHLLIVGQSHSKRAVTAEKCELLVITRSALGSALQVPIEVQTTKTAATTTITISILTNTSKKTEIKNNSH
jgi:hypothetical protein